MYSEKLFSRVWSVVFQSMWWTNRRRLLHITEGRKILLDIIGITDRDRFRIGISVWIAGTVIVVLPVQGGVLDLDILLLGDEEEGKRAYSNANVGVASIDSRLAIAIGDESVALESVGGLVANEIALLDASKLAENTFEAFFCRIMRNVMDKEFSGVLVLSGIALDILENRIILRTTISEKWLVGGENVGEWMNTSWWGYRGDLPSLMEEASSLR